MDFMIWFKRFMREKSGMQSVVKCQKIKLLGNFSKTGHRIVLIFCMMMEAKELYDLAQAAYAGKIWHALGMPAKMS